MTSIIFLLVWLNVIKIIGFKCNLTFKAQTSFYIIKQISINLINI